jgi:mono/diheme cytochrome c family protein
MSTALLAGCSSDAAGVAAGGSAGGQGGSAPATGKAIYDSQCASCHGADLRGTARGPSHLSKVYEPGHHNDASFRSAITKGSRAHHWNFGDMPAIGGLSDDQMTAVIAYVREVQAREGFEPYPPR